MDFGEEVRKARKAIGLSQDDIVDGVTALTGIQMTRQAVQAWEKRASVPGIEKWWAIEKVLGKKPGWVEAIVAAGKKKNSQSKKIEVVSASTGGTISITTAENVSLRDKKSAFISEFMKYGNDPLAEKFTRELERFIEIQKELFGDDSK